ncbi:MAG: pyrroline-5-carboxylate reductase [Spirochaetales bacterium]|nr:pyrroline-5-carboxylate reductase [Spirochaetales bacterium]MBR4477024.1 pyrroline-5-carboxylate reductase [Spirochaetales bacterium]
MARISVIGAGNMGGAFAEALSKRKDISLCIYDSCRPCADKIAGTKANVTVLDSMDQARGSDVVVIAVKPQVLPQIYDQLSALKPGFFISIAAGVTLEKLTKNLTSEKVVRFMPNIAAKIGHAVTAVAYSPALSSDERKMAMDIALSVGTAFELEESLFSAFIGISGSGIAYMFEMMHQMAMGGVRQGIPYPKALSIVADTMLSAANLQKETGKNAVELEAMVCSAKGTTIEGVAALTEGGFGAALINAVTAAARKSEELEKKA